MSQILPPQSLSGIQRGYDESELLQYNVQYIPSFLIKKAIEFGFIIPGWDLTDYILAAIKGNPNESIKRLGFVSVGMWGELGCLTSDMRVLTPVGLVKISNLKVGDEVISFSGEGLCSSLVTNTWVHVAPVYCVETGRRQLYSTLKHRFLTQRGWVEARYLNKGDKLLPVDFNCQEGEEVRGVSRFCSEERVYDITTSLGNYVAEDLVVHNSGKSNLSMQLAYAVHHDWDIVLDRVILMREDLVKTYRAVMNVDYRIPIAILDDVTTLLPRSLWQQDRELYTVFNKFLAVIRPKIACMISTVPDISWMLETMTEVMNFEVCVTPNQRFLVQRFYKETDPQKQASVNFMKILVEYADFDLENVPGDVWAEYQDRRQRLVDEVVKQLEKKLGSPKAAERVEIGSSGILAEPLGDKGIKYILGDDADRYAIKCVKCGHITSVEKDRKNKYVRCWGCKTVIDCRFGG